MIDAQIEIILIACITSVACAIPGTFLMLRKMSMLSDAISHSILLGIVLAYFFVKTIDSPILVVTAALVGVLTVLLVELIVKTKLLKEDSAIGIVYPFFFSIAVILISIFASQVHLDTDSVLMGELAFTPFHRLIVAGKDIGPIAAYQVGGILVINMLLTVLFYKEIRLSIFDESYARSAGFKPKYIHYGLMIMTSFTTVVAFEVAGAIMVVGFIIGPAVVASYLSRRLWVLLILAPLVGILASMSGYSFAHYFDVSIAGSIVLAIGFMFFVVFLFAPKRGLISGMRHNKSLKKEFAVDLIVVHLLQHEAIGDADHENTVMEIPKHLNWQEDYMFDILNSAKQRGLLTIFEGSVKLTGAGVDRAKNVMER